MQLPVRRCGGVADQMTSASQGFEQWTLDSIPRNSTVFVSFSNKHYSDFMLNWSKHLQRLQVTKDRVGRPSAAKLRVPHEMCTDARF
jgi:hypothetical protein